MKQKTLHKKVCESIFVIFQVWILENQKTNFFDTPFNGAQFIHFMTIVWGWVRETAILCHAASDVIDWKVNDP